MSRMFNNVAIRSVGIATGNEPNPYAVSVKEIVRYADHLSWTFVCAIGNAVNEFGSTFAAYANRCSLIQIGPRGPHETMVRVSGDALRGYSSPIRFPSATPSAPAGLACIVHGIRGPTLALTMPASDSMEIALALSSTWLADDVVDYAIICGVETIAGGVPRARCAVLFANKGSKISSASVIQAITHD